MQIAESDVRTAWSEIQEIHRRAVDEHLASLPLEEREKLLDIYVEREDDIHDLKVRWTTAGTPKYLLAPSFQVTKEDLGLSDTASVEEVASAFVAHFAPLWRVTPSTFDEAAKSSLTFPDSVNNDVAALEYFELYRGLPVVGGKLRLIMKVSDGSVAGVVGSFVPVAGVSTVPLVTGEEAASRSDLDTGENAGAPRLVVWSGHMSGDPSPVRLAWQIPVEDAGGGVLRMAWVDAADGSIISSREVVAPSMKRSLWDRRNIANYKNLTCTSWGDTYPPPPNHPGCRTRCAGLDPELCACPCYAGDVDCSGFIDDLNCPDNIWRYDDLLTTECTANGVPYGELDCGTEASQMWNDSERAYNYWHNTFGRHSWDGADDWVFTAVGDNTTSYVGTSFPKDTNGDTIYDEVQSSIAAGRAATMLDGHELGHALWFGTADRRETSPGSFWQQSGTVRENLGDVHSFCYQGIEMPDPYDCDGNDVVHYTQLMTRDASQVNKFIGNCNGWLMHQHQVDQDPGTSGYQYQHYGVTVTSTSGLYYDRTWYRAMSVYMDPSFDYFDWWQFQIQAAYDLYGFASPYYAALYSHDAIGSWTPFSSIASVNVRSDDRIGATSWVGASKGPCIFYRRPSSPTQIYYACYWPPNPPAPWITGLFNNVSVDPAASEPYATYGYFWSKNVIWVFWRGTDNRIRFRLLDVDTLAISDPLDLGSEMLTSSVPAAAPIQQPNGYDRIVVVFHPLSHPTYFYWTYIGDSDPDGTDMGAAFDSDVPPSLISYPHPDRVYFLRANFNLGSYPRHILYASYTIAGGWTTPSNTTTNLTAMYNSEGHVLADVVRTDKGLALAEYSRSGANRLNFFFVTVRTPKELWHGSLAESSPGVLSTGGYRAVPQHALSDSTSQAAGGLAPSVGGTALWHFWMPSFLSFWRKYSN